MENEKTIKFKYVFAEDYTPIYCNGAFGGISPQGEIIANFFLERMPIPRSVTNEVSQDGALSGVIAVEPNDFQDTVLRHVSTGIVMSEVGAKAVYEWLGKQIQELENRKEIRITDTAEE